MDEARVPYNKTGPATVKILAPIPVTKPSALLSIAGDATEFANPVIGTKVPAPANLAILSNTPKAVRIIAIDATVIEVRGIYISSDIESKLP